MTYREVKELLEGHVRRRPQCGRPASSTVPSSAIFGPTAKARETRCNSCRQVLDEAEVIRIKLHDLSVGRMAAEAMRERSMEVTRPLLLEARRLEIGPSELARLTGLSRQLITDLTREGAAKNRP